MNKCFRCARLCACERAPVKGTCQDFETAELSARKICEMLGLTFYWWERYSHEYVDYILKRLNRIGNGEWVVVVSKTVTGWRYFKKYIKK